MLRGREKYSDDQPRDESGKWTDGGGSDGGGSDKPSGGGKVSGKLPPDIRPPSEDVHDVAQAAFEFYKVEGDKTLPSEDVHHGLSAGDDPKRIDDLIEQISGPGGHWSRPIVDDVGNVLEGQHRVEAAKRMGVTDLPVHVVKDLGRDKPTKEMKEAVRAVGAHPDQVHNVVQNVLEAVDESGSAAKAREEFDFSGPFEKHHDAALSVLEQHETKKSEFSSLKTMPSHIEGVSITKKPLGGGILAIGGSSGIAVSTSKKASAAWKDMASYQKKAFETGWMSSPHPNHTIWHELAHVKTKNESSIDHDSYLSNLRGGSNPTFKKMAEKVSKYAGVNGHEMLAEVFAATRAGRKLDDDVVEYYDKVLKGPKP